MHTEEDKTRFPLALKPMPILLSVLTIFIIAFIWFFIQVRYDYYGRTSVAEALKFSEHVASAVDAHFEQHQRYPRSLSEITLPTGEAGYVPAITIDSNSGALTIAVASIEGNFGRLEYIRSSTHNQRPQWRCRNVSVSNKHLPAKCLS